MMKGFRNASIYERLQLIVLIPQPRARYNLLPIDLLSSIYPSIDIVRYSNGAYQGGLKIHSQTTSSHVLSFVPRLVHLMAL